MPINLLEHFRQTKRYGYFSIAIFMLSLIPISTLQANNQELPELGSASGAFMSPEQERRLGQAFMRSVKASEKFLDEPFAKSYIESLGNKLVNSNGENKDISSAQNFSFFILDNPQINAFAGPSGNIGVYVGLILTSQSESELAAVIAHEIAHVTQKHLLRTFHEASQMSIPSAAVILAAIILGAAVGGDAAIATAVGGQAALIQKQINFTRSNEKEADRIGIQTLVNSDYEAHAMPVFFERMGRANRAYSSELPEFLRSHPVTTNRIADSLARAEQHPYKQHSDSLTYNLVKALLKQRSFINAKDAEKYFKTNLDEGRYRNKEAQRFGLALSLKAQNKFKQSYSQVLKLLASHPTEEAFIILQSRLLNKLNKTQQAVSLLEDNTLLFPGRYSLNIELAELYIQTNQFEKSINLLKFIRLARPNDDQVFKKMAEAAGKSGDKVHAHEYHSDYLYLNGQLEPAIQQLEIALREKIEDFYLSSKLESKLQSLKLEFESLKKKK